MDTLVDDPGAARTATRPSPDPAPGAPDAPEPAPAPAGPPVLPHPAAGAGRTPTPRPDRLLGLDLARGLAVLGMFVAHTAPFASAGFDWGTPGTWPELVNGRSSVLFALCAGVSLALMTRDRRSEGVPDVVHRRRVVARSVALAVIGGLLVTSGAAVLVILPTYAVLFVATLPVLRARRRTLLLLAALSLTVGPVLALVGGHALATRLMDPTWEDGGSFAAVLLTGYPAVSWWGVVLVGVVVARADLSGVRTQLRCLATGVGLAVLGYGGGVLLGGPPTSPFDGTGALPPGLVPADGPPPVPPIDWSALLAVTPHAGSTPELVGALGVALGVLALCLLAARAPRPVRALLHPLAATGALALTLYVVHVLVLAVVRDGPSSTSDDLDAVTRTAWVLCAALVVGGLAVATAWRAALGQGPLERLLRRVSRTLDDPR